MKNTIRQNNKAIIFDYGATLDTNGIHWYNIFFNEYIKLYPNISDELLREAYVFAEKELAKKNYIQKTFNFKDTLSIKIKIQCEYIYNKISIDYFSNQLIENCYEIALNNTQNAKTLLNQLHKNFKLAIVSNFYGNLKSVLSDFGLTEDLDVIIESAEIGVSKPNPEIFQYAINKLDLTPRECIVIGDSYNKDIVPSKTLGCNTIWLKGKGWKDNPINHPCADEIIGSINELKDILDI